jgi:hypothetical protein
MSVGRQALEAAGPFARCGTPSLTRQLPAADGHGSVAHRRVEDGTAHGIVRNLK